MSLYVLQWLFSQVSYFKHLNGARQWFCIWPLDSGINRPQYLRNSYWNVSFRCSVSEIVVWLSALFLFCDYSIKNPAKRFGTLEIQWFLLPRSTVLRRKHVGLTMLVWRKFGSGFEDKTLHLIFSFSVLVLCIPLFQILRKTSWQELLCFLARNFSPRKESTRNSNFIDSVHGSIDFVQTREDSDCYNLA